MATLEMCTCRLFALGKPSSCLLSHSFSTSTEMLASQARGGLCRASLEEHRLRNGQARNPRMTLANHAKGGKTAHSHSKTSCASFYKAKAFEGGDGNGGGKNSGYRITGEHDDNNGNSAMEFPTAILWAIVIAQAYSPPPAKALLSKKKKKSRNNQMIDEYSDRLVNLAWPIAQNLGFSGAIGFMAGLALKVIGSAVAVALGLVFVIIQGGAYLGYIEVRWTEVHKEVIKRLDVNRDGKFNASDAKSLAASGLAILSEGVPSVGGFLAGFALALR